MADQDRPQGQDTGSDESGEVSGYASSLASVPVPPVSALPEEPNKPDEYNLPVEPLPKESDATLPVEPPTYDTDPASGTTTTKG